MKLDLLAFAAHPDDVELGCSGTILSLTSKGKKAGIVDLTSGELGTRGTPETRKEESELSSGILNLSVRENLLLPDGFFTEDKETLLKLIRVIRKFRPEIVLGNAPYDRHPDHGNAGRLASRACFLAGLVKIETEENGKSQEAWRPKNLYHYIQDRFISPDIIVDITPYWKKKMESIKAFKTQFFNPDLDAPTTYISSEEFLQFVESRAREMGHSIGVTYGEGFVTDKNRKVGVRDLEDLL